jgi:sulfide:quinone oxidoreductase
MSFETAPKTFQALQKLRSGRAVFTMPTGIIKCPGAGHKACYISEDYLRSQGRRSAVDVTFCVPGDKIFGIPRYSATIENLVQERGVDVRLGYHLIEVRGEHQEAVFEKMSECQPTGEYEVIKYDFLHVTPPQGPVDAVASSPLSNADGYVTVDKETLQHSRYPNVFGIGDCISAPTSRTAAAAAAQFLVLRDNLDALMAGRAPTQAKYDGYSSCPLVTKKGAVMMMEFGYDGKILETFTPFGIDQSQEQYPMWLVKSEVLPWVYWNLMVKGYVPWGEYKNMLGKVRQAVGVSRTRPAAA